MTLDQDATFIETETSGALYNYKGRRSYEALNVYCPEYDLPVATEFRDGNVNPGYGQLEQLQGVLAHLPEGVRKVKYRSDSAGYQTQLLRYLAEGQDARFGVIEFASVVSGVQGVPESGGGGTREGLASIGQRTGMGGGRLCATVSESQQEGSDVSFFGCSGGLGS